MNHHKAVPNTVNQHYEETHLALLRAVATEPQLSQRELAKKLGISLGKTNYCLKALIEKGCLKLENFCKSDNKLAYGYWLTPTGLAIKAELTVHFLKRKLAEHERLQQEIEHLQNELKQQQDHL